MTRYRKKPVEVEAWQVGSDEPMPEWIKWLSRPYRYCDKIMYDIDIVDGKYRFTCRSDDYIVRYTDGTIVKYRADKFEQTYEVAE